MLNRIPQSRRFYYINPEALEGLEGAKVLIVLDSHALLPEVVGQIHFDIVFS